MDKNTVEQVHFKPDETIVARGEDFNCVYKACHHTPCTFCSSLCHLFLSKLVRPCMFRPVLHDLNHRLVQVMSGDVMVMRGEEVEAVLWPGALVGDAEFLLGKSPKCTEDSNKQNALVRYIETCRSTVNCIIDLHQ